MDETTILVYISVSNTDQRLTLRQWSEFVAETELTVKSFSTSLFLNWCSPPYADRQGAVWAAKIDAVDREHLRRELDWLRRKYKQDEIAWAEGSEDFIRSRP